MLNRVTLQGRMVADPELRRTQSGTAVASFRLAVEQDFKDKETGQRKADFINCVAWRQPGEFAAKYFPKGSMAVVEGKLQTRDYTDKEGTRHFITEVNVDHIYFCGSKSDGSGSKPANNYGNQYGGSGYGAPQSAPAGGYGSQYGGGFTDISDSDEELPF